VPVDHPRCRGKLHGRRDIQLYGRARLFRRGADPGNVCNAADDLAAHHRIAANCAFISYGLATPLYPELALHAVLLPLNVYPLHDMLHLIAKVRTASRGDLSMDWLKPFMARTAARAGEVLFRKGDLSSAVPWEQRAEHEEG
jgi:hypothetical protein